MSLSNAERSDIEAAERAVLSLHDLELVTRVLNGAKGGSASSCEEVLRAYLGRCARDRGLGAIPVPPQLDGDGAEAWRASAWDARGKRGEERTLDVSSPALMRLVTSDGDQARAAGEQASSTVVSARARLEDCAGRRDHYRKEHGFLRDVVAERRAVLGRRVVVGFLEATSSFSATSAFFGLTSLPMALITGGRVAMAGGIGLIITLLVVWGIPALAARGLRRVSIGPRMAAIGLGAIVLAGVVLAGVVAVMRAVSSVPIGALTAAGVSAGAFTILVLSAVAVLVLMAYSVLLEQDAESLKVRAQAMASREAEFTRLIHETEQLIEASARTARECAEGARRPEVLRAAFGQAVTRAERLDAEFAIDVRDVLARCLDAFRHLMALSVPDRELVHNRVVAVLRGVADV